MKNLEKNSALVYFISIMLIPIAGIMLIFSYAFSYVNDEVNFTQRELKGLHRINQVQYVVFDIQRLRGLSSVVFKDKNALDDFHTIQKTIEVNTIEIQNELAKIDGHWDIKVKLEKHLEEILHNLKKDTDFKDFSMLIEESIVLINQISYRSKLILDKGLHPYILAETIVSILPKLIEFNGKIRGISASINGDLSLNQRDIIMIQLAKIEDTLARLKWNMSQITSEDTVLNTIYENMLQAQNSIVEFTRKKVLIQKKMKIDSINLFKLNSNNIDLMILLYKANSEKLHTILIQREKEQQSLIVSIFLSAIIALAFIIYINVFFFIRNKKYIEDIKQLSITDSMTNLYNRRHFDTEFTKHLKIAYRAKENLTLMILDIDHFKQFNDTYGHHEGDTTLIAVAKALKDSLHRPSDMAFRLGGEEFGILCINMNHSESEVFANKIRENVHDLQIEHSGNSASQYVSVSIGIHVIAPAKEFKDEQLYKNADKALYKAKEYGRNQVVLFQDIKEMENV